MSDSVGFVVTVRKGTAANVRTVRESSGPTTRVVDASSRRKRLMLRLGLDREARDERIAESYRQEILRAGRMWNQPRNPPPPPQASTCLPTPPRCA